jgi:hypothetical protein
VVSALAIIGDEEPMELLLERLLLLLRRIMKVRMQRAAIARNPKTTMTAIAQCGNESLEAAPTMLVPDEEAIAEEDDKVEDAAKTEAGYVVSRVHAVSRGDTSEPVSGLTDCSKIRLSLLGTV